MQGGTCEETLGRKCKQPKAYASMDTLKKIKARKKVREMLNRSRTRAKKEEAQIRYSEANTKHHKKSKGSSCTTSKARSGNSRQGRSERALFYHENTDRC